MSNAQKHNGQKFEHNRPGPKKRAIQLNPTTGTFECPTSYDLYVPIHVIHVAWLGMHNSIKFPTVFGDLLFKMPRLSTARNHMLSIFITFCQREKKKP